MTFESKKPLSFAESGIEHREEPVIVRNIMAEFGYPTLMGGGETELNGETVLDKDLRPLESANCPFVVFGRPHVGEYVPKEYLERMTEGGKKWLTVIDRGTQAIYKSDHIPSIGFKMSRFIVDPNRAPDPESGIDQAKSPGRVLWYNGAIDTDGYADLNAPIYQEGKEPSKEEVRKLVEQFYIPYYNAMMSVIGNLADRRLRNQRLLLIDGHSYPTTRTLSKLYSSAYGATNEDSMPLFEVGDKDGMGCDEDIRTAFAAGLEQEFQKLSPGEKNLIMKDMKTEKIVGVNEVLKGVHNIKFWGKRDLGVNALQLEINERPYCDDVGGDQLAFRAYKEDALMLVRTVVERAALSVDPLLRNTERSH